MALGGITTPRALFVLETLAEDRGMRVVYRGAHEPQRAGRMTHHLSGPESLVASMARELGAGAFEAAVAHTMARRPVGRLVGRRAGRPVGGPAREARTLSTRAAGYPAGDPARDETLTSWIITPRSSPAPSVA